MKQADCIIIGGGIAGIQAAIQLGRYKHNIIVIDSSQGRSSIAKAYHNILGWPDGVSGKQLRTLGRQHAEKFGVEFLDDTVTALEKKQDKFFIQTKNDRQYQAKMIFLGTGITDNIPPIKNIYPTLGTSTYICPDCDGYEIMDKQTVVLGGGNTGAGMALTLLYWSKDIIYVNHLKSKIDDDYKEKLKENQIPVIEEEVCEVHVDDKQQLTGIELVSGKIIEAEKAFTAFKGNKLNNDLALQLGVQVNENKHVLIHPRTKETNIKGVWAGGDLVAHSEQVTISMGDGTQAAIWIHKRLLGQPLPYD
ncbi:NAD(P)/FAD-dependent oxidoreductase [Peribacillus sp. NPDC101481]|uniref:NAD(P)/FAD-dependent oxidoreductase n=1 Tax=Bacillaceae TaxID=186817 RepID=UPI000C32AE04|nr:MULTISPECIES: NAD(P)/FAD-dependent oxidoreductase [Bacillaceae]MCT4478017.1 NAD(P)/FAD-dependent oxidoreductase [Peribacillus frigoritolerans]PKF86810.1 pyridine nucleotide-disulfide oxidoreductase [Bacillus sp. BA3]CAH0130411.1 Thioredoxin reductase [Peribacillus sp. Bi134]